MQTNCAKLSCRFEHIRGNFCGFSAFIAAAALKRDALFGEIKPDGNNWAFSFFQTIFSAVHFHLRIKCAAHFERAMFAPGAREMRLEKR